MRIAMIGQKGAPAIYGGVERHVEDLSQRLTLAGHEVTIYSRKWYTKQNQDFAYKGMQVVHTPNMRTKHLDTITHTLTSTIHALFGSYDVIHYHGVGPTLLSWIPRLFARNTKVIATFHCIDRYHQKWGLLARIILRMGEWTACNIPHQTITVSEALGLYCLNEFKTNTHYIPNGVNIPEQISDSSHLKAFGLEKGKYLTMVSRLVPHKGAHLLIEAFNNLKRKHAHDDRVRDLKLAIVGGGVFTDGYVRELHKLAGQSNNIVFTDFQSGDVLESLYANCSALVHPSLNEGLPLTVLQAMSYEKPVLLSNIPEHLELTQDIRAIFNQNEVEAVEKKMLEFILMSDQEKMTLGQINRETVEIKYRWDVIAEKTIKLYEEAVNADEQSELIATVTQA
ncbi:glycosyltransferase family 4 protein [Candidatus Nomurabacteria bacterium]|nr:glycosyltransferase family 4 protein [Candidatus Nomurabacteria bacterium]